MVRFDQGADQIVIPPRQHHQRGRYRYDRSCKGALCRQLSVSELLPLAADAEVEEMLVGLRWPSGVECPHCLASQTYRLRIANIGRNRFKCRSCHRQFSVTKGTILEGSKLSLPRWVDLIRCLCDHPDRLSLHGLQNDLDVSSKTVRNALDRLNYALAREPLRSQLKSDAGDTDTPTILIPPERLDTFRGMPWQGVVASLLHTKAPNS